MYCVNCGNKLEEGVHSCPLCNTNVEEETVRAEDVKDFVVEYSTILKEKGVKLIDASQKKVKEVEAERVRQQARKAEVMKYGQESVIQRGNTEVMKPQQERARIRCPKCQNENLQMITESVSKGKDFSAGKGCCGAILLGPIGILCGACGKGKQVKTVSYWICPQCGNKFKA